MARNITQEQGKTLADAKGDIFRGLGAIFFWSGLDLAWYFFGWPPDLKSLMVMYDKDRDTSLGSSRLDVSINKVKLQNQRKITTCGL